MKPFSYQLLRVYECVCLHVFFFARVITCKCRVYEKKNKVNKKNHVQSSS
jgi:hypothetical protein